MNYPKIFEGKARPPNYWFDINEAQSIFEAWLRENGQVVWGYESTMIFGVENDEHITHQALLVCIEKIKECEHRDVGTKIYGQRISNTCRDCGAKLKPTKFEVYE